MQNRPVNALLAVGVALLPLPAMKLLDRMSGGCGDGLCGFIPGLAILAALLTAMIVLLVRSGARGEAPTILRLAAPVLFLLALAPMMF